MATTVKQYASLEEFIRIGDFLIETYRPWQTPNWLQARWEYMHFHPNLDLRHLGQVGIWEDDGAVVGVVHYEDQLGDAYFQVHPDYGHLKAEMLDYAEAQLAVERAGERYLRLVINEFDAELIRLASERGYRCRQDRPQLVSLLRVDGLVNVPSLPAGFRLVSLAEENDLTKLNRCLWRGFNHPGEPGGDLSGRRLMQSTPNFDHSLNVAVVSPRGEYVSYSGIWYDQRNQVAYVEPVATDPDYRRMGLGRAAVLECVRRTAERGANIVQVGSGQAFYQAIGFRPAWATYFWEKTL